MAWLNLSEDVVSEFALREGCLGPADYKAHELHLDETPASVVERVLTWKKNNADHVVEYDRARYLCNATARRAAAAAYYAANREKILARRLATKKAA